MSHSVFVCATAFSLWLQQGRDLYDTDSFFHLAIARIYAEEGIVDSLPALRFSLLQDGFGDKEWLFHTLLAPFAGLFDPLAAGHLALALFHGLLATLLAAATQCIVCPPYLRRCCTARRMLAATWRARLSRQ